MLHAIIHSFAGKCTSCQEPPQSCALKQQPDRALQSHSWGVPHMKGAIFGGPKNKDYNT